MEGTDMARRKKTEPEMLKQEARKEPEQSA